MSEVPRFEEFCVTSPRMTVWVKTRDGIIVDCAPIANKFRGQKLNNLLRWLAKFGGVEKYKLKGRRGDGG